MGHFMTDWATRPGDATRSSCGACVDGRRRRRGRGREGARAFGRRRVRALGSREDVERGWTRDRDDARRDAE